MQHPGFTRSSFQHDHLLQTPDTFVRTPLPGMQDATAVVHTAPANRAAFTQYTVEMSEQSSFCTGPAQTFIYVLDGEIAFDLDGRMTTLGPDQYAYLPSAKPHGINSRTGARAAVIGKPRIDLEGHQLPPAFTGDERTASPQPLGGDESLQVRTLLPPHPAFDFAVNTITFDPGASLPMVEIHCME